MIETKDITAEKTFILGSMRYAFTRRTHVPSDWIKSIKSVWNDLEESTRLFIRSEVRSAYFYKELELNDEWSEFIEWFEEIE